MSHEHIVGGPPCPLCGKVTRAAPQQPQSVELDEILMALMVAGAIEANNSKDGKLTVEIMETSRGFKGSKTALTKLIASVANEVIDKPHTIWLTKNPDGTIDMKDDVVAHWDYLRARQHEHLAQLLNQSEGKR